MVTGGELTLEMLELRYDPTGHYYEAPLHVKALGGCLLIDDFGRQIVSPTNLLNRWIVPLEGRVDYLKLHTGKTFSIPFEELVIFSTNLEPEDLMDPAFLRRLPYKIEVGAPSREHYRKIFDKECEKQSIRDDGRDLRHHRGKDDSWIRGWNWRPITPDSSWTRWWRPAGSCAKSPHFEPRFIDYAIDNLRVRHGGDESSHGRHPLE